MLIVDRKLVHELFPMHEAIASMREALAAHANGRVFQPLRMLVDPPALEGLTVVMPAQVHSTRSALGMKVVSVFAANPGRGLDTVQGFVLSIDPETGVPTALLDGASITEIRTAAVSAIATDLLAREEAGDLAILGAGVQARGHLRAMAQVRKVKRARVWNRTRERGEEMAEWARQDLSITLEVAESVDEALMGADIVCTTLGGGGPVVRRGAISPGCHINAIGAFQPDTRELESEVVADAIVFVDSRESALAESGDILIPIGEGRIGKDHIAAEIGDVVIGRHSGRTRHDEVTLFKSLGMALEDVASAAYIEDRARATSRGVEISFP